MQATTQSIGNNALALGVLGILAAIIVVVALTHTQLPFIGNPRVALMALIVVGFAMCTMGMAIAQYGWVNPFNIVGSVIGVVMLVIGVAALFGISLPLVADERAAILVIAVLMVVKVVLAGVRGIIS